MTAAVSSTTTAPATSRADTAISLRDQSEGTNPFDLQLHAARQQQEPSREPADASSRKSSPAPSRESADRSTREPAGASTNKSTQASKGGPVDHPVHATSAAGGTTITPADTPASSTSPLSVAKVAANNESIDPRSDDEDDGDQASSALAGNMLALLGLSAGIAFGAAPAKVGDAAAPAGNHAGKEVAVDDGTATLLPADGVDGAVAAMGTMPMNASAVSAGGDVKMPALGKTADGTGDLTAVLAMSAPPATAAPVTTYPLQLQPPVGSQAFSHELGQQVVWLAGQDIKQARIRLHPEDLGELDVKISVTHDRVDVVFSAQHPAAVTAVQQSLSQLGQMLTQHGLSLGNAEVGQHDHGAHRGRGAAAVDAAADDADEVHDVGLRPSSGTVSLLDAFA